MKTKILTTALTLILSVFSGFSQDKVVKEINQHQFSTLVGTFNGAKFKAKCKQPAVIDFYADWCMPCKRLAPVLEELAKEYREKVTFYKVNVDNNTSLTKKVGASSIPLVLFVPADGSQPQSIVGLYPKAEIKKAIEYMFFSSSK